MNEIFGRHRQDFNEIRRLCLICHGLDKTSDTLFDNSTYNCESEETKRVFQNLVSGSLLNLAVALRINNFQGEFNKQDSKLSDCGCYYEDNSKNNKLEYADFSIRDVCNKIIHADSMSKSILPLQVMGESKMTVQFKGKQDRKINGEYVEIKWTLNLSVEHFAEAVLNFLDELEANEL